MLYFNSTNGLYYYTHTFNARIPHTDNSTDGNSADSDPARRQQISAAGLSPQKHDKPHVPSHTVRLRRPDRCRPIRRLFTDPSEKPKYTSSERRIRSDLTRYNTGRNGIYRTGNRYDEASETVPTLFTRKQRISSRYGRSSDLFRTARLPGPNGQWLRECTAQKKLTATGIVPDFHRIPF